MTKRRVFYFIFMTILAGPPLGAARAWEVYDHSFPYDTETVDANPHRVQIHFTEPVAFREATMVDAAGKPVPVRYGIPEDDMAFIEVAVPPDLGPGRYVLTWKVWVTAHGHADSGEIRFTIKGP